MGFVGLAMDESRLVCGVFGMKKLVKVDGMVSEEGRGSSTTTEDKEGFGI